jgi:hypothetical protein
MKGGAGKASVAGSDLPREFLRERIKQVHATLGRQTRRSQHDSHAHVVPPICGFDLPGIMQLDLESGSSVMRKTPSFT